MPLTCQCCNPAYCIRGTSLEVMPLIIAHPVLHLGARDMCTALGVVQVL